MKFWLFNRELRWRYALAMSAGVLLAASFPKFGIAGFAWIAPGLLLASAACQSPGTAFRMGYVGGFTHFLVSLYWLLHIPVPVAPIVGWLGLSGFLALYSGAWVWLCWKVFPGRVTSSAGALGVRDLIAGFSGTPWWQRLVWALACGALWVTWEMAQARVLSGFPWNLLGASQYKMLPLIQISRVTGVYGVSFLVVWTSVSFLSAASVLVHRPQSNWLWRREFFLVLFMLGLWSAGGFISIRNRFEIPKRSLKVALIQPSIPQTVIWDPDEEKEAQRFRQLIELTERALASKPDLVAWPEAAVPSLFRWSTNHIYNGQTIYEAITGLARQHGVWMIIGADDAEPGKEKDAPDFFNSSFLISPQGQTVANYRKQRLVMFGEYVPLSRTFPFLKRFTQVYGEFKPGKGPVAFGLRNLGITTSVLICFEDVFPHLAREHIEADTDFLLNLTNNGWFGESAAQWQHASSAALRAVENGLPLVRAANNGLSCWVDAYGAMHDIYFPGSTDIYQAGFKVVEVPLAARNGSTFYNRHGDWFGWGCVGLSAVLVAGAAWTGRRGEKSGSELQ